MRQVVMSVVGAAKRLWHSDLNPKVKLRHLIPPVGLGLLAAALIFWRLGEGSLFNWDEATYADLAKQILATDDWVTLHRNGAPFFKKPPLYIWLTALAYKVFGINEFAARFWSAVSGVGVVLGTYFVGSRLLDRRIGLAGGVLLLGINNFPHSHGYNFLSLCRVGHLDVPLMLVSLVILYLGWLGLERPRYLLWMGVPLGVGFMIKNVAAFFPWCIIALLVMFTQGWRGILRRQLWGGLGLGLLIALPWHAAQVALHGMTFVNTYLVWEILTRTTESLETAMHTGGLTYYLNIIRWGFPVWSWLMVPGAAYFLYLWLRERNRAALLILLWIAFPLVFFTLARTKIGWYVAMIYPALALLTAAFIQKVLGRRYGVVVVLVGMLLLNPRLPTPRDGSPEYKDLACAMNYLAGPEDAILSFDGRVEFVPPAFLFYSDRAVTLIAGGREDDLMSRLAQLDTGRAVILTNTEMWHEGLPGEVVRRWGKRMLVMVDPHDDMRGLN